MNPIVAAVGLVVLLVSVRILHFLYGALIKWRFSPLRRSVPGVDPPSLIFGHQMQIAREPFMAPHQRWWDEVGRDKTMIRYYSFGMSESVLLLDPKGARAVLRGASAHKSFPKAYAYLRRILGDGLVTLDGDGWSRHRRIIQPAFDARHVRALLERHVPPAAEKLCRAWETLPPGTPVLLHDHLGSVTLDVIGRAGFGHDFGAADELVRWAGGVRRQADSLGGGEAGRSDPVRFADLPKREVTSHPVASAFVPEKFRLVRPTVAEIFLGPAFTPLISRLFPSSRPGRRASVRSDLDRGVDAVVSEQRARCEAANESLAASLRSSASSDRPPASGGDEAGEAKLRRSSLKKPRSILELLVSEYAGLTDEELRDEAKTFVVAGAETTSTAVNLAVFAMCTQPNGDDVQRRLYEDVVSAWPDESEPLTADVIDEMPYVDAVLKETLRLFPPVGMIVRQAARDVDLEGARVPRGTRLVLSMYLLHRNERVWGERASEFLPERWMSDEAARAGIDPPPDDPFAFLPFSAGGRQCIGKWFAMLEAKIILATIARRFRFRLAAEQKEVKFTMSAVIVMSPKPQFLVEVNPRKKD